MKKLVLVPLLLALGAPAAAQSTASVTYNLEAEVPVVCGVYSSASSLTIDFGDLATVDQAAFVESSASGRSAGYRCNSPNGFTRTISSDNQGFLIRTGSNGDAQNRIPVEMRHGGGIGSFAYLQLTQPKSDTFTQGAFLAGVTGSVVFKVPGVRAPSTNNNGAPGTTVLAGDYTDVVRITVTAL